ncbi:SH3 domain-containing protein [Pediococcus parvulus]
MCYNSYIKSKCQLFFERECNLNKYTSSSKAIDSMSKQIRQAITRASTLSSINKASESIRSDGGLVSLDWINNVQRNMQLMSSIQKSITANALPQFSALNLSNQAIQKDSKIMERNVERTAKMISSAEQGLNISKAVMGNLSDSFKIISERQMSTLKIINASADLVKIISAQMPKMSTYDFSDLAKVTSSATKAFNEAMKTEQGLKNTIKGLNDIPRAEFYDEFFDLDPELTEDGDEPNVSADQKTVNEVKEAMTTGRTEKLSIVAAKVFRMVLRYIGLRITVLILMNTPTGQSVYQWEQVDLGNQEDALIEGNGWNPKVPKNPYREVKIEGLALRMRPKHNAKIQSVLKKSEIVKITQTKRNWKRVVVAREDGSKVFGWTNTTYLKIVKVR